MWQFLRGSHEFRQRGEEVFPSISPLPRQFLPLSISIFHHSTSPSSISLTFNFHITLSPSVPLPTLICLPWYISQPPLHFPLPFHIPLIFHFLTCDAIHLFLSLLCLSVDLCSLPSLPFYISIASSHFLSHHMNCCAVNSPGVTPVCVTGLSRSW